MVKLGSKVTDSITGLTGIAIARCEYLNGCISVQVQPQETKDGEPVRPAWLDEQRLDVSSSAEAGGYHEPPPDLHP